MSGNVAVFFDKQTMQITSIVKTDKSYGLAYHVPKSSERVVYMNRGFYDSMHNLNEVAAYVGLPPQRKKGNI